MGADILEWIFEHILPWILIVMILFLFIGLPIMFYKSSHEEKFTLTKSEWSCVHTYTKTWTNMIMVGKVMVPQIHTEQVCDNYVMLK